jgi:hypothetical protein
MVALTLVVGTRLSTGTCRVCLDYAPTGTVPLEAIFRLPLAVCIQLLEAMRQAKTERCIIGPTYHLDDRDLSDALRARIKLASARPSGLTNDGAISLTLGRLDARMRQIMAFSADSASFPLRVLISLL